MSPSDPTPEWNVPEELSGPVPRRVRLTGGGIAAFIIGLALMPLGVAASWYCFHEIHRQRTEARTMAETCLETGATVTYLSKNRQPYVKYEFVVGVWKYPGSRRVESRFWDTLRVGSPITVCYLPSDPFKSFPRGYPPSAPSLWISFLPAPTFAGIGCLLLLNLRSLWRYVTHARAVAAVVTGVSTWQGRKGVRLTVIYEFRVEGDELRQGQYEIVQDRFSHAEPPVEGSLICVLYDPKERTRSHRPQELFWVRAASR